MASSSLYKPSDLRRLLYFLIASVGLFVLYFAGLGSYPLVDVDEPIYGQVAREMATGGDWLTPHYNGKPWFDKPPMFYWLSAGATRIFGDHELAVRIPSALMAVGLVVLVYLLALQSFGLRVSIAASVVMATCLQQVILARAAVTDMTFVYFLTLALYAYSRWFAARTANQRIGWALTLGASTGLAILSKGPVAPVLLGTAVVAHLAWVRSLRRLISWDLLAGLTMIAAVGLPWYVFMYVLHQDEFVRGFLVANNITRFLSPEHVTITGGWHSYLMNFPTLLGMFLPWSVFLPAAIAAACRDISRARIAVVWIAVVFVFFSLSKTQLVTYIFPLYPAAAILVGLLWDNYDRNAHAIRVGLWIGTVISILVAAFLVIWIGKNYTEASLAAWVMGLALAGGFAVALILSFAPKAEVRQRGFWALAGAMVVFTASLIGLGIPHVTARLGAADILRKIPPLDRVLLVGFDYYRPSVLYYWGSIPENIMDPKRIQKLLSKPDPVYVLCRRVSWEAVRGMGVTVAEGGKAILIANKAGAAAARVNR